MIRMNKSEIEREEEIYICIYFLNYLFFFLFERIKV